MRDLSIGVRQLSGVARMLEVVKKLEKNTWRRIRRC